MYITEFDLLDLRTKVLPAMAIESNAIVWLEFSVWVARELSGKLQFHAIKISIDNFVKLSFVYLIFNISNDAVNLDLKSQHTQ